MKSLLLTVVLAGALVAAPGARALTIDNSSGVNPDGSARFVDPDEQVQRFAAPAPSGRPLAILRGAGGALSISGGRAEPGNALRRTLPFGGSGPSATGGFGPTN